MEKLVSIVSSAPQTRSKNDDDFADRLSSRYTVIVLVVFAIVVTGVHYAGSPITCWAPVHFTGSHTSYTNSYCWVRNTYYLPFEDEVPHEGEPRQYIYYYQWIPFILLGQAMLFYLPTIVWHGLNSKGGIDADNILEASHTISHINKMDKRESVLRLISNQIDRFLQSRQQPDSFQCDFKHVLSATLCRPCGRRIGNYLVLLFLFSKILYILNVIGQMFLLNKVLTMPFNEFGFDITENIMASHDWTEAQFVAFPRVTFCDFNVRRLGNVQRYTVQCTLPINMYNEKIYLFLWFWMVFVAIVSCLSFVVWLLRSLMKSDRVLFLKNHLVLGHRLKPGEESSYLDAFASNYLRQDGCFLLRLIAHNTNNITTTEVTCALWDLWREKMEERPPVYTPTTEDYEPLDDVDNIVDDSTLEVKPSAPLE